MIEKLDEDFAKALRFFSGIFSFRGGEEHVQRVQEHAPRGAAARDGCGGGDRHGCHD